MKPYPPLRDDWRPDFVVGDLSYHHVASLRILGENMLRLLLKEAEGYAYKEQERYIEKYKVRQELSSFDAFPPESAFFALRDSFQTLLEKKFRELEQYPFETPLAFNDFVLQKYEDGSAGISPHRDGARFINLVCIFVLKGRGRFCICEDRSGARMRREINTNPGDVILMRAPGFQKSSERPLHLITDVWGERISFGLRQRRSSV